MDSDMGMNADANPNDGTGEARDPQLERLIRAAYLTANEEIDCSTCLELVPIYVDLELSGADAARRMPALRQHLAVCTECRDEYESLSELARLDAAGVLPSTDELLRQLAQEHSHS